jgi:ABC-type transport system involved in multi-copper enzyme maturation permease subunit
MARIYLSSLNPVAWREMKSRVRGLRTPALFFAYLAVLGLFIFIVYLRKGATGSYSYGGALLSGNYGPTRNFETGQDIFISIFLYQILMVAVVTPAICGGLVSREIEGGTYDLLLVTPVKGRTLIYGKLIGAVGYLFVLIMATLPLTCIVFIFGGVSPEDILAGYAIVLMEAVVLGIISLFFSAVFQLTNVAVIFTYFIIALLLLGVPVVSSSLTASINADTGRAAGNSFRVDPRLDPDFDLPKRLLVLNPFAALGSVLAPNAPYRPSNGEDLQMFPNSRLYWGNPTAYFGTPTFLPNTSARQRYEDAKLPVLPYGLALWQGYLLVYTAIGLVFLILSMGAVKPLPGGLIYYPVKGLHFLRRTLPALTKKGRRTVAAAQIAPVAAQPAEIFPVAMLTPETKKTPEVETTGEISQPGITVEAAPTPPPDPPERHREALG